MLFPKEEGRQEGQQEATVKLIVRLLTKRLGQELSQEMQATISHLPLTVLENQERCPFGFYQLGGFTSTG